MSDEITPQLQQIRPSGLPEECMADIDVMLQKWQNKLGRNQLRSRYYDGRQNLKNLGIAVPPTLSKVDEVVGWPAKAVDALANRVVFDGFVSTGDDRDPFGLDEVLEANDFTVELPKAIRSALKHSCSFVCLRSGDTSIGEPEVVITFRSALYATGIWNMATRSLRAAMVVQDIDDAQAEQGIMIPTDVMLYEPGYNIRILRTDAGYVASDPMPTGLDHVPVWLLAYHSDLDRPFGRSRINREVMSITDQAARTMLRMDIGAEFYSAPRAALIGAEPPVDKDGNPITGWEAAISHLLVINADEDGVKPSIQQLSQMTMQPHSDQLRVLAARMSGATDIPMAKLGVMTDSGPSSADAIAAGESDLVIEAKNTCDAFGVQLRRMAKDIALLNNGDDIDDKQLAALAVNWRDPERPSRASRADAILKQVQAIPWLAECDVILEELGYDDAKITRLLASKRKADARSVLDSLTKAATQRQEAEVNTDDDTAGRGDTQSRAAAGGQNGDQGDEKPVDDGTGPERRMAA